MLKRLLQKLITFVANEPVVAIAGFVSAALVWVGTYVFTGFDPSSKQELIAGVANAVAVVVSLIARQFVTPVK